MNEINLTLELVVAGVAVFLSMLSSFLLIPVYGKLFFSTHRREFVPLDEWKKQREDLGLSEKNNNGKQNLASKLREAPPSRENYDELKLWNPSKKWSNEEKLKEQK